MNVPAVLALALVLSLAAATPEPQRPIYIQYTVAGHQRTASYFRVLSVQSPRLSGPDVQEVQRQLRQVLPAAHGLTVDGYYGPATAAAVRHFQSGNSLTPSGAVNFDTWTVLFRLSD